MSLRGTGVHAKTAACFLQAGVSGGTLSYLPLHALDLRIGYPASIVLIAAYFSIGAVFPLYLNLVPAAKRQVDPMKDEYVHDDVQRLG